MRMSRKPDRFQEIKRTLDIALRIAAQPRLEG